MKPKPTMSIEEEAAWRAKQSGSKLVDKQAIPIKIKRRRTWTINDLWEKWAIFGSKYPTRDGAEFLVWLEK